MDSNTHSTQPPGQDPDWLAALAVVTDKLATQDLDRLPDAVVAERVLRLRQLVDRLEGHWLHQLAAVDGRRAAGAELDQEVGSTAAWLRNRLRLRAGTAASAVRTARALFRGSVDRHRPGPDRRRAVGRPRPGGSRHPPPARPGHHAGRGGPGRGGPAAGPTPAAAAPGPPAPARPPRRRRPGPRTPSCPPGPVAGPDLRRHGGGGWAVGARGQPDPAGRPGAVGPPGRRHRCPQWQPPPG